MTRSSYRALAPNNSMSAHAHMLTARAIKSSPIFPTPDTRASQSISPPAHFTAFEYEGQAAFHGPAARSSESSQSSLLQSFTNDEGSDSSLSPSIMARPDLRSPLRRTEREIRPASYLKSALSADSDEGSDDFTPPSSPSKRVLKLRLRGMQGILHNRIKSVDNIPRQPNLLSSKRTSHEAFFDEDDDTDSEIDIMPPKRNLDAQRAPKHPARRTLPTKKHKVTHLDSDYTDSDSDSGALPTSSAEPLILSSTVLKRAERMLDPNNREHAALIAAAPKAGRDYYDSDGDELPGPVKETSKPHLFRNVKWGSLAHDYSDPTAFPTEPEFTQFVPGRYELLPSGVAFDQKHKLLLRLTDTSNRQRIFTNPPPIDWNSQLAITALNKRTVQQIRRNTRVRFREVVTPYITEERQWIKEHLEAGKPRDGWRKFVAGFNARWAGKRGAWEGERPERSHSSLTKEVERFGGVYAEGGVPGVDKMVVQDKKKVRKMRAGAKKV